MAGEPDLLPDPRRSGGQRAGEGRETDQRITAQGAAGREVAGDQGLGRGAAGAFQALHPDLGACAGAPEEDLDPAPGRPCLPGAPHPGQDGFDVLAGAEAVDLVVRAAAGVVALGEGPDLDLVGGARLGGDAEGPEDGMAGFERLHGERLAGRPLPAALDLVLVGGAPALGRWSSGFLAASGGGSRGGSGSRHAGFFTTIHDRLSPTTCPVCGTFASTSIPRRESLTSIGMGSPRRRLKRCSFIQKMTSPDAATHALLLERRIEAGTFRWCTFRSRRSMASSSSRRMI